MNPTLERLKLIFLTVFVVLTVAMLVWQVGWIWPQQNCEKSHRWWDNTRRICAQPVLISDITGRVIADSQAREEVLKALGRTSATAETATPVSTSPVSTPPVSTAK